MRRDVYLDAGKKIVILSCAMLALAPVAFSVHNASRNGSSTPPVESSKNWRHSSFHNVLLRGSELLVDPSPLEEPSRNDANRVFKSSGIPLPVSAAARDPTALQAEVLRRTFGNGFEAAAASRLHADIVPCVKRSRRRPPSHLPGRPCDSQLVSLPDGRQLRCTKFLMPGKLTDSHSRE